MIHKIIPYLIGIILLTSCQKKSAYQNAETIPGGVWSIGHVVNFRDSLTPQDPENLHFEINLQHTNIYPYQNIWLYIHTHCSDGTTRMDSIDWKLSEPDGHWLGKGWGSLYNISYQLPDLTIRTTGRKRWFNIEIQHGLRDDHVKGLENIGIRLY